MSLGLVLCLLPSTKNKNEEIAAVESISSSPGNFWFSNTSSYLYFLQVVPGIDFHIKNNIRIKYLGGLTSVQVIFVVDTVVTY